MADRRQSGRIDETSEPIAPPRQRRRRRIVGAVAAVLAVVVVTLVAVVWWGGSSGRQVTVDEARDRIDTATTVPPVAAELRPAQGVYLYRGGGTDSLSTPPKEQTEGPDMPATVEHRADGCWTFRIDYHSNHWQTWVYCPRDGGLVELGGTSYQRWDFGVFVSETTSTFECADAVVIRADAKAGDEWDQTCSGGGDESSETSRSTSAGPYRFVGPETLTIGGQEVEALRYHRERTMSGSQRGTETADVWFGAADGLPLRNERRIEVRTDTVIGETTYTEAANFELTALEPTASGATG